MLIIKFFKLITEEIRRNRIRNANFPLQLLLGHFHISPLMRKCIFHPLVDISFNIYKHRLLFSPFPTRDFGVICRCFFLPSWAFFSADRTMAQTKKRTRFMGRLDRPKKEAGRETEKEGPRKSRRFRSDDGRKWQKKVSLGSDGANFKKVGGWEQP